MVALRIFEMASRFLEILVVPECIMFLSQQLQTWRRFETLGQLDKRLLGPQSHSGWTFELE